MKKFVLVTMVILLSTPSLAFALHGTGGTVYADVNGLVCDFCARALEKVFSKQDSVSNIEVNLDTKVITINFKNGQTLDDDAITKLITNAGYNVTAIRHGHGGQHE